MEVTSKLPQGSVLGPLLLLVIVNDLPEATRVYGCMFADGEKIMADIGRVTGCEILKGDADAPVAREDKRRTKFNQCHFHIMRVERGSGPLWWNYGSDGERFNESNYEKDLEILIQNILSFDRHSGENIIAVYALLAYICIAFRLMITDNFEESCAA